MQSQAAAVLGPPRTEALGDPDYLQGTQSALPAAVLGLYLLSTALSIPPELPDCLWLHRHGWSPPGSSGETQGTRWESAVLSLHPHMGPLGPLLLYLKAGGAERPCSQEGQGDPEGLVAKNLTFF